MAWVDMSGTRDEGDDIDFIAMTRACVRGGSDVDEYIEIVEEKVKDIWVNRERKSTMMEEQAEALWSLEETVLETAKMI